MVTVSKLPNPGKSPGMKLINLRDFSGGIASRNGDMLDVRGNELRDAKNVTFQATGGVSSRGGITQVGNFSNANFSGLGKESPSGSMYFVGTDSGGGSSLYATISATASLTTVTVSSVGDLRFSSASALGPGAVAFMRANPTDTDWSSWVACGANFATYKNSTTAMTGTNPTFQDSYGSPSGSYFPRCRYVEPHQGYMFAAVTFTAAGAAEGYNRIRWSHPGDPGSWRTNDYIDLEVGTLITGMHSIGEQLVIFTNGAVYSLRGYSPETFQLIKVSDSYPIGDTGSGATTYSQNCKSHDGRVFWLSTNGVWMYDGSTLANISEPINELLGSTSSASNGNMCFARILNRDVLVVPWGSVAGTVWVCFLDIGAWSKWYVPHVGSVRPTSWSARSDKLYFTDFGKLQRHDSTATTDNPTGSSALNIDAYFTTGWIDADQPVVKKSWKRPEMLYRASGSGSFVITSYVDYNTTADRTLTLANAGSGSNYEMDTSVSLGPARAISLKVQAPTATNVQWSIEDIVLKYRPKRVRN